MDLVIFSNKFSIIALAVAAGLYLLIAISRLVLGEKNILASILGGFNILLHIAIFALCLYIKASAQEMLFILVVSTSLALAVTRPGKEEN